MTDAAAKIRALKGQEENAMSTQQDPGGSGRKGNRGTCPYCSKPDKRLNNSKLLPEGPGCMSCLLLAKKESGGGKAPKKAPKKPKKGDRIPGPFMTSDDLVGFIVTNPDDNKYVTGLEFNKNTPVGILAAFLDLFPKGTTLQRK